MWFKKLIINQRMGNVCQSQPPVVHVICVLDYCFCLWLLHWKLKKTKWTRGACAESYSLVSFLQTFIGRFRRTMDSSQNAYNEDTSALVERLDSLEKRLFKSGQSGLNGFQSWEKGQAAQLTASSLVLNYRKRKMMDVQSWHLTCPHLPPPTGVFPASSLSWIHSNRVFSNTWFSHRQERRGWSQHSIFLMIWILEILIKYIVQTLLLCILSKQKSAATLKFNALGKSVVWT